LVIAVFQDGFVSFTNTNAIHITFCDCVGVVGRMGPANYYRLAGCLFDFLDPDLIVYP